MAKSNAQPLILLTVSLSFSSVLCQTIFQNCVSDVHSIHVVKVKISPNPVDRSGNANITIIGSTTKDIPEGVTVKLQLEFRRPFEGSIVTFTKTYSLCDVTAYPTRPSGLVLLLFSNIFTRKELEQATLSYNITISITDNDLEDQMMCIQFPCPTH